MTAFFLFMSGSRKTVVASPVLLHNLGALNSREKTLRVRIRAVPASTGPPMIPVATSVTLARVTSPLSTLRKYDDALSRALRDELKNGRLLVQQGDLIAIRCAVGRLFIESTEDNSPASPATTHKRFLT
jgi:peroxin-6